MRSSLLTPLVVLSLSAMTTMAFAQEAPEAPEGAQAPTPPAAASDGEAPAAEAEGRTAKNAMYLELLGNGLLYSINYDRAFTDSLTGRIGFSYFSLSASSGSSSAKATFMTFPVMANYLVGGGNHNLELGLGALILYAGAEVGSDGATASGEGVGVAGTGTVGYRYQPMDGGFVFRVGFTPVFTENGFFGWGGLSLGGAF